LYLLISALLVLVFVQSFETILEQAGLYRTRVLDLITKTNDMLPSWLAGYADAESLREQLSQIPVLKIMRDLTGDIFGLLGNSTLVVIFTLFLLAGDPAKIENKIFREFQNKVSRYVVAKVFVSALTAIITLVVFLLVGADLAF